jgi:hypothetical protein
VRDGESQRRNDASDEGFTIVELLMATTLLTVLRLAVERGVLATSSMNEQPFIEAKTEVLPRSSSTPNA